MAVNACPTEISVSTWMPQLPHLDPRLVEFGRPGQLFPAVDVRVVRLRKGGFQLLHKKKLDIFNILGFGELKLADMAEWQNLQGCIWQQLWIDISLNAMVR